jgi:hypothetical protein
VTVRSWSQLRAVSDAWLQEKSVAEKGSFRSGSSIPGISRGVRSRWSEKERRDRRVREHPHRGAATCELSVDLMRYREGARER